MERFSKTVGENAQPPASDAQSNLAAQNPCPPELVRQAGLVFLEIASIAATALDCARVSVVEDSAGMGRTAASGIAAEALPYLIDRIGWLADMGAKCLINDQFSGGAVAWLCPPNIMTLAAKVASEANHG
jgi:hypothetical protein